MKTVLLFISITLISQASWAAFDDVEKLFHDLLMASPQYRDITDPARRTHQTLSNFNSAMDLDLAKAATRAGQDGLSIPSLTMLGIKIMHLLKSNEGLITANCDITETYVLKNDLHVLVFCDRQRTRYQDGQISFYRRVSEKEFIYSFNEKHQIMASQIKIHIDMGPLLISGPIGIMEAVNLVRGLPNKADFLSPENAAYLKRFPKFAPFVDSGLDYHRRADALYLQEKNWNLRF